MTLFRAVPILLTIFRATTRAIRAYTRETTEYPALCPEEGFAF